MSRPQLPGYLPDLRFRAAFLLGAPMLGGASRWMLCLLISSKKD